VNSDLKVLFYITIHYIAFPGYKVSENDCRIWNMSYKYKNMYSITEVFTQENTVITQKAIYGTPSFQLLLFIQPLNGCHFLDYRYSSTE
jgi:hypothetical protein